MQKSQGSEGNLPMTQKKIFKKISKYLAYEQMTGRKNINKVQEEDNYYEARFITAVAVYGSHMFHHFSA